jgi:hypothetical protein
MECDRIFGCFTDLVMRYYELGMTIRAAHLAAAVVIPEVLKLEAVACIEVHKGALFYDTGLAFFMSGDMDRCAYYIALANEEDVLTGQVEGHSTPRGLHNRFQGALSRQLARPTIDFAVGFLNEPMLDTAGPGGFQRIFGHPLDSNEFDSWRVTLGDTHHFEFFRILQELEIFDHRHTWTYARALDNPFLLLRLAKVLAHAAQWFESYLTTLQSHAFGPTLSPKLRLDLRFAPFHAAAGGEQLFAGHNPPTSADVDTELRNLLDGIRTTSDDVQRRWRALRIAYIVRNSMSHHIDDTLSAYQDRPFVRHLIQHVVLASLMLGEIFTHGSP